MVRFCFLGVSEDKRKEWKGRREERGLEVCGLCSRRQKVSRIKVNIHEVEFLRISEEDS